MGEREREGRFWRVGNVVCVLRGREGRRKRNKGRKRYREKGEKEVAIERERKRERERERESERERVNLVLVFGLVKSFMKGAVFQYFQCTMPERDAGLKDKLLRLNLIIWAVIIKTLEQEIVNNCFLK
jgi:hypothetical protein